MSVREYQAQLLAPAIDSLMTLDNALLELSEAVYGIISSALQALASYFDVDNVLLRYHSPSQRSLLAHAVPVFWVPLGVALALVTLFSLASFIHALATYTWSLLRPIDAYSQASYNQSMKYSDSSMIPLSPGRLSMATEHRDPTERIPTYGLHTDHSVLERVRARPDMQMLERWRVRPAWSIWPARVLRLLERKDYAELEGEIVRELEKGAIKRAFAIKMSGWEVRFSNSRQVPYFYNASTRESVWDPPAGLSPQQISSLPGADRYLQGSAPAPAAAGASKPGQVRASHILAKHTGSRRPSSWKQDKITRSPAEARQIIEAHIKHLESLAPEQRNAEFAKIASTESDCSSAKKGGDLGWFGKGMMQKSFEDATYALEVGQLSPIVESDSGIHVILRTG